MLKYVLTYKDTLLKRSEKDLFDNVYAIFFSGPSCSKLTVSLVNVLFKL